MSLRKRFAGVDRFELQSSVAKRMGNSIQQFESLHRRFPIRTEIMAENPVRLTVAIVYSAYRELAFASLEFEETMMRERRDWAELPGVVMTRSTLIVVEDAQARAG